MDKAGIARFAPAYEDGGRCGSSATWRSTRTVSAAAQAPTATGVSCELHMATACVASISTRLDR